MKNEYMNTIDKLSVSLFFGRSRNTEIMKIAILTTNRGFIRFVLIFFVVQRQYVYYTIS